MKQPNLLNIFTKTKGNIQWENLEKITTVIDYTKNVTTKQNLNTEYKIGK